MSATHAANANQLPTNEWIKSSLSGAQGNCVEMASLPSGDVAMRNSRDPNGPALLFTAPEIRAMIGGAANGDFDRLI